MNLFFEKLASELESGRPAELVSILTSGGSTPRGAGAMMAVFPGGRSDGSIGGGSVEYEAQRLAAELLAGRRSALRTFRFIPGGDAGLGMICGGDVTLHFQFLPGGEEPVSAVFRELAEAEHRGRDAWLVRRLEGERVTAMGTADRRGSRLLPADAVLPAGLLGEEALLGQGWSSIRTARAGRVYLFGAGHVAGALVPALDAVGFHCTVLDDRAEFALPERFPQAERVAVCDFSALKDSLRITPDDYLAVMTRGHQADYQVLTQVLRSGARYIGCIGSRRKLELCRGRLLEAGFTPEEYAVLHAPIGLSIGARTPEEIAVSVTAELIAVRAGVKK